MCRLSTDPVRTNIKTCIVIYRQMVGLPTESISLNAPNQTFHVENSKKLILEVLARSF